jgi:hypothetical protein
VKVISVIQPWATLLALNEKGFETRSWATKYRGELAIHASKKIDKMACRQEPFKSVLAKHRYDENNLPIGVILAIGFLEKCYKVIGNSDDVAFIGHGANVIDYVVQGNEYAFGDYTEGRYAWDLQDIKMIKPPIPAKGQLGIWNYKAEKGR